MTLSKNQQLIVDDKGNPTAVIIPIERYKKIISVLEEVDDLRETKILSQSKGFSKLVKRGLADIEKGKVKHWREIWDEI